MRFFHISDLHIGKRVNGFSMLEDQKWILQQILELAEEHRPDGVLIAGDLYDKSMPSAEAVELADEFLYGFVKLQIPVWVISGNHDSAERVAYGSRMMEQSGIYLSRVFDGTLQCHTFGTEEGEKADIYLLPYVRPAGVRRFFMEENHSVDDSADNAAHDLAEPAIRTTQQAVAAILGTVQLREDRANILVIHQFMTGAAVCDSEELSVGGTDQVDAAVVEAFDYVALGHLHGPQRVGSEKVRYCGSPLKYSFSEAIQKKSVTEVEILHAGRDEQELKIRVLPLKPLHDLREIRGPLAELIKEGLREKHGETEGGELLDVQDYLHVTLTDEDEVMDAIGKLRAVYPNLMRLDFVRHESGQIEEALVRLEDKSPQELFAEFYQKQNGVELNEQQKKLVDQLWEHPGKAGEDGECR